MELTNEQRFEVVKEINKLTADIDDPTEYSFAVLNWIKETTLDFRQELLEKAENNVKTI